MKSTEQQVQDKENGAFVPSKTQLADTIGIPRPTYNRIRKLNQCRRDLLQLQGGDSNSIPKGTIFSHVVKSKGWTKVNKELEEKVHSFIENHPNAVQSPIMNDCVSVRDKADPIKVEKIPKLLLQVSIQELHNDLIDQLPEASEDGIQLVSDSKLRHK